LAKLSSEQVSFPTVLAHNPSSPSPFYGDPTNDAPLRDALQSKVLETKDLVEILFEYLVLEQNHPSDVSENPSAVPSQPASGMLEAPSAVLSQSPSDVSNASSSVPSQSQ
jgi:hypothetical protein